MSFNKQTLVLQRLERDHCSPLREAAVPSRSRVCSGHKNIQGQVYISEEKAHRAVRTKWIPLQSEQMRKLWFEAKSRLNKVEGDTAPT